MDAKNAFRAGLVVVAGLAIAIGFIFVSKKTSLDSSNSYPYYALLTDAAGVRTTSMNASESNVRNGKITNHQATRLF